MPTITRLFDHHSQALDAIRSLEENGRDLDISLIANNTDEWYAAGRATDAGRKDDHHETHAGEGAATGAGIGAVLGGGAGLLAGLGLLAIPGVGPVVAAGWLASTAIGAVGGAAVGGATGGLIGALTRDGESEEDAHVYAEGVRRGGSLVSVRTRDDDQAHDIAATLERHGGVIASARRPAYQEDGWERFDESAEPYSREQVQAERARYKTAAVGQEERSFGTLEPREEGSITDDRTRANQPDATVTSPPR